MASSLCLCLYKSREVLGRFQFIRRQNASKPCLFFSSSKTLMAVLSRSNIGRWQYNQLRDVFCLMNHFYSEDDANKLEVEFNRASS